MARLLDRELPMMRELLGRIGKRRAAPGWLVVDIGEGKVTLAHVRPEAQSAAVEFVEEREWDVAQPKSLERVAREFGARRHRCTTLLRPDQYQILLVEAPAVKPEELRAAVRWRIKDMLDFHVDDATIDVLDVPVPASAAQRTHSMYAIAARSDTVRAVVERFDAGGFPLEVIDIPDTAQRNLGARLETGERAVLALSFDGLGGLITVNHAGELYLTRRLDISDAQLAEATSDARTRLFDRILVEVQRSLDHCERSYSFLSLGRLVLGPPSEETGLREHLASNLYLPVESLALDRIARLPAAAAAWSARERAKWLKLIGAGLRVDKRAL